LVKYVAIRAEEEEEKEEKEENPFKSRSPPRYSATLNASCTLSEIDVKYISLKESIKL